MVGAIALSADAITMEAMRRVDEWKRIRKAIRPETVFIRVKSNEKEQQLQPEPHQIFDPSVYMLSLVDGISNVASFCTTTFLTEYRVCETLLNFWQNNRIMPLKGQQEQNKSTRQQKIVKHSPFLNARVFSFVLVHLFVMLVLCCGYVFRHTILFKKNQTQTWSRHEWSVTQSENKIRISSLNYHALTGNLPTTLFQLENAGFIIPKDEAYLKLRNLRTAE